MLFKVVCYLISKYTNNAVTHKKNFDLNLNLE